MHYKIRDLRDMTGMTQKAFAAHYGIPLSTLRKWEQGEASPADYVVALIAKSVPAANKFLKPVRGQNGTSYFYDAQSRTVYDSAGNAIRVNEGIEGVKEQNLPVYLADLFEDLYAIRDRFDRDCRFDKQEDIIWSK